MPSLTNRRIYEARLYVSGEGTHGELYVNGFTDAVQAREIGEDFADVLRKRYPDNDVMVSVKADRAFLAEEKSNG